MLPGFFGRLRARIHRHRNIRLRECRRIVGAVAGHWHEAALCLIFANQP